jgi:putative ABC transport system permease protein
MTASVLERPAATGAGGAGGVAARRAVIRWSWRLFRREWRQQLLVLALIIVAVGGTILGAAVATNSLPPANAGFGTASHLVSLSGADPNLTGDLGAIKAHFGTTDVIENQQLTTGLARGAQLRAQDSDGPYGRPMLAVVSGRYPAGASEVALTKQLAATFNVHVGGLWTADGHSLHVVGMVENPQNLLDDFALVAPGQLSAPGQVTVLFDATSASASAYKFPQGASAIVPTTSNGIPPALVVFAIAIVGLIFVGLVAVAGFTVLAQRRMRSLGMLSSLGATDRNVRLVMVANGAVVGIVGAVIGAVLGLVAWIAYAPSLSASVHRRLSWTSLPWWLVAVAMLLAILTATFASRRPARAIARVPVVAALSGRPAPPKAVHRSAIPGSALLVISVVLLATSGGWTGSTPKDTLFQLGGLLASAVGLLLLAPVTISALRPAGRRAPIAGRIALRDLARYRSRSGPALAAISFAILIAMLITLLATGRFSDPVDYFGPNLASNQLVVYASGTQCGRQCGTGPTATSAQQQAAVNSVATTLNASNVLPLDAAPANLFQLVPGGQSRGGPGSLYVATPTLLAHYGINPNSIRPTTLLITSRAGLSATSRLQLSYGNLDDPKGTPQTLNDPSIQAFHNLPTDTSAPNLLVTEYAVQKLDLQPTPSAAWLITAPKPVTAPQKNAARQAAVAVGQTIETKNDDPSLAQVRNYATAVGILLALGVLAMTIGLVRSESAGELRTLTATGASSQTRRAITGITAATLGLLGAVLGTAVAYVVSAAFFRTELSERMSHVPVLDLVLVLIGLPVAAAVGGWLFAGRQPAAIARNPLE